MIVTPLFPVGSVLMKSLRARSANQAACFLGLAEVESRLLPGGRHFFGFFGDSPQPLPPSLRVSQF